MGANKARHLGCAALLSWVLQPVQERMQRGLQ
jgi:hypothetical protein